MRGAKSQARLASYHVLLGLLLVAQISRNTVLAQKWCGKNYMRNQTVVPPGGQFPIPPVSITPLLALRCTQGIRPFLPSDSSSTEPSILISAHVTSMELHNSSPFIPPQGDGPAGNLSVTVSVDGQVLTSGSVPIGSTLFELPLLLSKLQPRREAYTLQCSASTQDGQTFSATGKLTYLPEPSTAQIASSTKMDLRTGAILAKGPNGQGEYQPIFPVGFYTQFEYLTNLTVLSELKQQGFNVVHPIPPFSNLTALKAVLDEMEKVGLYLMYDMRWTYMNNSRVTEEVNRIKTRPNLLLWYTADEPDGTSDPLNATVRSYNLINSLDGGDSTGGAGYHPVSLVLNCQDYEFSAYANGTDIIMQDVYHIGNNVTFSSEWGTQCTTDHGDCGCDNCKGSFKDISDRVDEFWERMLINGWERTKAIWSVPQGFGNSSYWKRYPTGREFVVQSILAINHGARGLISWQDPTTPEIKESASRLASALPEISRYIFNPKSIFYRLQNDANVDISTWTLDDGSTLLLAANLNYNTASVYIRANDFLESLQRKTGVTLPFKNYTNTRFVFTNGGTLGWVAWNGGDQLIEVTMDLKSTGSGAFLFHSFSTPRTVTGSDAHEVSVPLKAAVLCSLLTIASMFAMTL